MHTAPSARVFDPLTSHLAAMAARPTAETHREAVLRVVRANRAVGAEQIADALRLQAYEVRKRTSELQAAGLISVRPNEFHITRAGRKERVWFAL